MGKEDLPKEHSDGTERVREYCSPEPASPGGGGQPEAVELSAADDVGRENETLSRKDATITIEVMDGRAGNTEAERFGLGVELVDFPTDEEKIRAFRQLCRAVFYQVFGPKEYLIEVKVTEQEFSICPACRHKAFWHHGFDEGKHVECSNCGKVFSIYSAPIDTWPSITFGGNVAKPG